MRCPLSLRNSNRWNDTVSRTAGFDRDGTATANSVSNPEIGSVGVTRSPVAYEKNTPPRNRAGKRPPRYTFPSKLLWLLRAPKKLYCSLRRTQGPGPPAV